MKIIDTEGYIISRNLHDDSYGLWRFQPDEKNILAQVRLKAGASYDHNKRLIWIGGYMLEWGPQQEAVRSPYFEYRLLKFDPTQKNPLAAPPLLHGQWPKEKFWQSHMDFSNPGGGHKEFMNNNDLILIPLGTYLLLWIPTEGRGTYALWNFDPGDSSTLGSVVDPVGGGDSYPVTAQASFRDMQKGDELIPLNGYVLNRRPATGEYRLWSFDPQARNPLVYPAIQRGTWPDINDDHKLVPIGDCVLDWVPATKKNARDGQPSYRLWRFDPKSTNPLTGPVRSGKLPKAFTSETTLLGFQPNIPIDQERASIPGTIDFMRTKIKHVVYYMLENRSFDHVAGWLYEGKEHNVRVIGPKGPYDGASTKYYNKDVDTTNTNVYLSKYKNGKLSTDYDLEFFEYDPYHDNSDILRQFFFENRDGYAQRATPDMGGFIWNNSNKNVMMTYTPEQLPVLNGLALNFAISDRWFCSIPASTDANRAFVLTGSAMMELNNFMSIPQYIYWPQQPHRPSIFKLLWTNGINNTNSWKIYNSTQWLDLVFTYELFLQGQIPTVDNNMKKHISPHISSIDQFYQDAKTGDLPSFSFLEPVWIGKPGETSSYHPGMDLVVGEKKLNGIYDALRKSPKWEQTLLVITFDEHGGIFDHVPPPYAENPWPNDENDGFRYDLMGPRVPTILVSPWIDKQTVFRSNTSVEYDGTSFTATLLRWFGIPKARWFMGERTNKAPTFEGVFTRAKPRQDSPSFTPPYDKTFPPDGSRTLKNAVHELQRDSARVHGLQRDIARVFVASMGRGKLTPEEITHSTEEMLREATDGQKLTDSLDALKKRLD